MSPATDEENSNIMLLLDAAEELHKTASHDGPEPSTAATHGDKLFHILVLVQLLVMLLLEPDNHVSHPCPCAVKLHCWHVSAKGSKALAKSAFSSA